MPFSEFVIELGLELELEVEWEKALEKESEKDLRMFDGSCSWGRICVGGVVFYVVPMSLSPACYGKTRYGQKVQPSQNFKFNFLTIFSF